MAVSLAAFSLKERFEYGFDLVDVYCIATASAAALFSALYLRLVYGSLGLSGFLLIASLPTLVLGLCGLIAEEEAPLLVKILFPSSLATLIEYSQYIVALSSILIIPPTVKLCSSGVSEAKERHWRHPYAYERTV